MNIRTYLTMASCKTITSRTLRIKAVVAERLRRWTRNPMGSPRAGSNPADCEIHFDDHTHDIPACPHGEPSYMTSALRRDGVGTKVNNGTGRLHESDSAKENACGIF